VLHISASQTGEGQYSATLNGELTLRGATRAQAVPARVTVTEDAIRAFGEFSLLQTDYG